MQGTFERPNMEAKTEYDGIVYALRQDGTHENWIVGVRQDGVWTYSREYNDYDVAVRAFLDLKRYGA